jgi:hypothetical protein
MGIDLCVGKNAGLKQGGDMMEQIISEFLNIELKSAEDEATHNCGTKRTKNTD